MKIGYEDGAKEPVDKLMEKMAHDELLAGKPQRLSASERRCVRRALEGNYWGAYDTT